MKSNAITSEEPPALSDLKGWRQAVDDDRLHLFQPEDIVAAIQHVGPADGLTLPSEGPCDRVLEQAFAQSDARLAAHDLH